jgi:hypothetical protein
MAWMPLPSVSVKSAILVLLAIGMVPLHAQDATVDFRVPILSVGGDAVWGKAVIGRAVGFVLLRPHQRVSISARLGNGGGSATADVFLTRTIGPGTTIENEVAYRPIDLPYPFFDWFTLFEDLDLDAGEYWLVVARPREKAFSSINWIASYPPLLAGTPDLRYLGARSFVFRSDAADYLPASRFDERPEIESYQIEVACAVGPTEAIPPH